MARLMHASRGVLASAMLASAAAAAAAAAAGLYDLEFIAGPACISLVGLVASAVVMHRAPPAHTTVDRSTDCLSCSCGFGSACCFQAGLAQNWVAVGSIFVECVQLCSIALNKNWSTSAAILTGSRSENSTVELVTLISSFAITILLLASSCFERRAAWVGAGGGAAVLPVSCRLARAALDARAGGTELLAVAAVAAASAWSVVATAAVFAQQRRERRNDVVVYAPWFAAAEVALKAALALVATVCADVGHQSSAWALILAGTGCSVALLALLCFRPCTVASIGEVRCVALLAALWAFLCAAAVELIPLHHRAKVVALFGGWLAIVLFPGFGWVCWHARAVAQTRRSARDSGTDIGSTSEMLAHGAEDTQFSLITSTPN